MFEQEVRKLKSELALCIKRIYIGEGLTGNRYETILSDDADELIRKALEAARSQGATNGKTCADCGKGIILGSRIAVDGAKRIFHRSCGGAEFAKRQSTIPGTPEYARMEAASNGAQPNESRLVCTCTIASGAAIYGGVGMLQHSEGCPLRDPSSYTLTIPADAPQTYADGFRDGQENMTFAAFANMNRQRCEGVNGFNLKLSSWSMSEWFTAVMGELGEAANVAKKLNRVRDGVPGNKQSPDELRTALRRELGDVYVYLDLLAQSLGFNIGDAAKEVFDAKSAEIGYEAIAALPLKEKP